MALLRVIAVALMLVSTVWSSHPFESTEDQYEAREVRLHPLQLLREATDHPSEVYKPHRFKTIEKTSSDVKNVQLIVPELQVGCADGLIHEKFVKNKSDQNQVKLTKKLRSRREAKKEKRSYYRWSEQTVNVEPYQSISVWKPPTYQISRPYYVPVFGVSGRIPIYFPAQPLLINPGVPPKNPVSKPSFQAPNYLPPISSSTPPTAPITTSKPTLGNKFNIDELEVGRIWDTDQQSTTPSQSTRRPQSQESSSIIPTRRPRPVGAPKTLPPLLHNPSGQTGSSSQSNSQNSFIAFSADSESFVPSLSAAPTPVRTTPAPLRTTPRPSQSQPPAGGPSRCVWAIISCCSASSNNISYNCFDQLGCPGAFWDNSPCESEFAKAAIASALKYYNK